MAPPRKPGDRRLVPMGLPPARPGDGPGDQAPPAGLEDLPTLLDPSTATRPFDTALGDDLDERTRDVPPGTWSVPEHASVTRRVPPSGGVFDAATIRLTPEQARGVVTVPPPPEIPWPRESTRALPPAAPPGSPSPPPPAPPPPEPPARYELRGEHARGGQARVLLAWDRFLEREVAWKEAAPRPFPGQLPDEAERELAAAETRLLTEARITGQLEHPSIVPVYELGWSADGKPYYTMRRIQGEDLAAALARRGELPERLALLGHFRDLCHAIAFAHSRGVLHRDLKPHNVMIGSFGETVLLDWGLARRQTGSGGEHAESLEVGPLVLRGTGGDTTAGSLLGTPAYMSPEQARGLVAEVDERTDIWGLGAVLYEILTGRPPYVGRDAQALLRQATRGRVTPVSRVCPAVPPELAAIAGSALRSNPTRHYSSAKALADDVNAYLTGGRVQAYRYRVSDQVRRLWARHRLAFSASLVALAAVLLGLVMATLAWQRERTAHRAEQAALSQERQERLLASLTAAEAHLREADRLQIQRQPLSAGVQGAAALLANPAYPASPAFDPDFAALHPEGERLWIDALSHVEMARLGPVAGLDRVLPLQAVVPRVGFSEDGQAVVATDLRGRLWAWNLDRDRVQMDQPACAPGTCLLAIAQGSARLVTAEPSGRIAGWRLGASSPDWIGSLDAAQVRAIAVDPDGALVAAAGEDGLVHLLRANDGILLDTLPSGQGPVGALAFNPDGSLLAAASLGGDIALLDSLGQRPVRLLPDSAGTWGSLMFSPDGHRLLGSGSGERSVIWDIDGHDLPLVLSDGGAHLSAAAFSPDGAMVAVGGYDGMLRLWDGTTGRLQGSAAAHPEGVLAAAFSPDGRRLATAGLDGAVRLWHLSRPTQPAELVVGTPARGLVLSRTRPWLATACQDGFVRVFDTRDGEVAKAVRTGSDPVVALALSPDDGVLVTAHQDHSIRAWDLESGDLLALFEGQHQGIRGLAVAPSGRWVASAARDGTVALLDLDQATARNLVQHESAFWALAVSPDGRRLATGDAEGRVQIWDIADGSLQKELRCHDDWVTGLAFSADGRRLATAGKDARVLLWDLDSGARRAELMGHRRWVNSVAFSAEGDRLLSAGDDGLVVLWDLATARPLLRVRRPAIAFVADFLPDGESFAFLEGNAIHLVPLARHRTAHPLPGPLLLETLARSGLTLEGLDLTPVRPAAEGAER
ncbi:MAG: serine/threonine-protein kinase [Pseudomonadota bacterium]